MRRIRFKKRSNTTAFDRSNGREQMHDFMSFERECTSAIIIVTELIALKDEG